MVNQWQYSEMLKKSQILVFILSLNLRNKPNNYKAMLFMIILYAKGERAIDRNYLAEQSDMYKIF